MSFSRIPNLKGSTSHFFWNGGGGVGSELEIDQKARVPSLPLITHATPLLTEINELNKFWLLLFSFDYILQLSRGKDLKLFLRLSHFLTLFSLRYLILMQFVGGTVYPGSGLFIPVIKCSGDSGVTRDDEFWGTVLPLPQNSQPR